MREGARDEHVPRNPRGRDRLVHEQLHDPEPNQLQQRSRVPLTDQGALPDAAGANVGEHLKERRNDEPERLRLPEELRVLVRSADVGRHRDDDGQEEHAGDETSANPDLQMALFQFSHPDVPVAHGISMILQFQRKLVGMGFVRRPRLIRGRAHQLEIVLNQHAV
jgi:hypothetical protein